jgi:hypothetical protein
VTISCLNTVSVVSYIPPRFNDIVKAIENKNKGGDYTKIGNLDII